MVKVRGAKAGSTGRADGEGARCKGGLDVVQVHDWVGPWAGQEQHVAVERHRQDETVVIVGMLTDQVDPAGGAEEVDGARTIDTLKGRQGGGVAGLLRLHRFAVDALEGVGKGHRLRQRIGDGDIERTDLLDDDVDGEFVWAGLERVAGDAQRDGRADGEAQRRLGRDLARQAWVAAGRDEGDLRGVHRLAVRVEAGEGGECGGGDGVFEVKRETVVLGVQGSFDVEFLQHERWNSRHNWLLSCDMNVVTQRRKVGKLGARVPLRSDLTTGQVRV